MDILLDAYRSHVAGLNLPQPCCVQFNPTVSRIDVQIGSHSDPATALVELLAWTHTLHGITASWWRTISHDNLHITIEGRSQTAVEFKVYAGIDYVDVDGLVRLEPGERESVSVDALHLLAGLLREAAA